MTFRVNKINLIEEKAKENDLFFSLEEDDGDVNLRCNLSDGTSCVLLYIHEGGELRLLSLDKKDVDKFKPLQFDSDGRLMITSKIIDHFTANDIRHFKQIYNNAIEKAFEAAIDEGLRRAISNLRGE